MNNNIGIASFFENFLIRKSVFFELVLEESVKAVGAVVVLGLRGVVGFAVGQHPK